MLNKFVIALLFFAFPVTVAAKSVSFTVPKTSVKGDEELVVTASASGFATGEQVYIKGSLYKEGTDSYFGYTKNDSTWVKNSTETSQQRKVTVSDWNGQLIIKPDYQAKGFTDHGNGSYIFKVRYYTVKADGSPDDAFWSTNTVTLALEAPPPTNTPTQTPTKSPTQTPTKTPTPQPTQPTATAMPKVTVTKSPTSTPRITPTPTEEEDDVLGVTQIPTPIPTDAPEATVAGVQTEKKDLTVAFLFIGLGTGILSLVTLGTTIRKKLQERKAFAEFET